MSRSHLETIGRNGKGYIIEIMLSISGSAHSLLPTFSISAIQGGRELSVAVTKQSTSKQCKQVYERADIWRLHLPIENISR